jgi:hypothetical protein
MKSLHRPDLFCWSRFDEGRNVDFHGWLWVRREGNVLVDPLPLTAHDRAELDQRGGAKVIVITNGDHTRAAQALAAELAATLVGPAAERGSFPFACDRWVGDGEEIVPGLRALALEGSKTPGELALVLEGTTLICGDLVRGQRGGALNLLPAGKLQDPAAAAASVRRLAALSGLEAVLVGDGWPVFRDGGARLAELAASLEPTAALPSD